METKKETWYIYTLPYNGESYFADTASEPQRILDALSDGKLVVAHYD